MNKAVFIDRDGVITKELGYICPINMVEVFPYVRECVKIIHEKGYLAIVVTNQSGVARGIFSEEELVELNNRIQADTMVDAIYFCPHHEKGVVEKYKINCNCRKPNIGMIEKASKRYNIKIDESYMVGDRATDIICGENAKLKTVLVNSGYGIMNLEQPIEPDYIMDDLKEFANWLK